ncbi:protein mono-ADP-ribosyltransferase PARP12-like [Mya arenaria]|uniref:protein mono-ADP-ribosyltransferase PARP12-like n=1 Tax=Mya arenaria TaxID=6604 RepID=UPI0022E19B55|nr:protein mono-ADP-ribosyltransferase PARP12-like [Mya arenaria]
MTLNLKQPGMEMVVLSPKHSKEKLQRVAQRSKVQIEEMDSDLTNKEAIQEMIKDYEHDQEKQCSRGKSLLEQVDQILEKEENYPHVGRFDIGVAPDKEKKEKKRHRWHIELHTDVRRRHPIVKSEPRHAHLSVSDLAAILREETSGTTTEFVPVTGLYTSVKNGVLQNENVSYQCITMMEDYKEFSLEELRSEDYLFNRGKPRPPMGIETSLIKRLHEGRITLRRFPEVVKFDPLTGQDTLVKNGLTQTVNTLHNCITAMAEYTHTSLEELRVKDYERWLGNEYLPQEEEIRPRTETKMATDTEFLPETSTSVAASMIHYGKSGKRDGAETICTQYLEDRCKDQNCQFLHPDQKLPYVWQINLADKSWASLPMNVKIEDKFCASADSTEIYNINVLNKEVVFQIQFKANLYAVQAGSSQPVAVRRLSTPAYTLEKDVWEAPIKFDTQWRWFWQDDEEEWNKFTPDSLQQTLEIRYRTQKTEQNEQRYYSFFLEDGTYLYDVDLQQMTQTNIVTSKTRELRRRPLLVMPNDIIYQKGPESLSLVEPMQADIETPQHWSPQDSIHSFELVRVSLGQEYITVVTKFFETMSRDDIDNPAIYRVQNLDLWSQYISKRKSMQIKAKRLGRDKDLEIRELFHGTDTLEAARGICIHTIDPRVSGKHGTAFGHGAYFARDACYSDRYTTGGSRFVFLTSVLVGEYTKGNKDYRRPPSKPGTMHGDLFDTCVDSITDPAVFVAFDRAQYYPGYLIVYKNRR